MPISDTSSTDTGATINDTAEIFKGLLDREAAPASEPKKRQAAPEAEAEEAEADEVETEATTQAEDEGDEGQSDDDTEADEDAADDADAEEETDADAEEEGDDDADLDRLVTVKIDGKTQKVKLSEAIAGYQRQADYTRKATEVAESRKAIEAEVQAVKQERQQYSQLLTGLAKQLQAAEPQVDWEWLKSNNPSQYAVLKLEQAERREKQQAIRAEQARLSHVAQTEHVETIKRQVAEERDLMKKAIPAWTDDKVWQRDRAAIKEYGRSIGFTDEQLSETYDHRAVLALYKAMQFDKLSKAKATAKPVVKKIDTNAAAPSPKKLKPGSSNTVPRRQTEFHKAQKRQAATGSIRDTAALFEKLI